jgi:hypothetical protein
MIFLMIGACVPPVVQLLPMGPIAAMMKSSTPYPKLLQAVHISTATMGVLTTIVITGVAGLLPHS